MYFELMGNYISTITSCLPAEQGMTRAFDGFAIYGNLLHAFLPAFWVLHGDVVFATTELAGYLVFMGGAWQTRVDDSIPRNPV